MTQQTQFDPRIVEAEENLLIDFQFLIQEMMSAKNITRTDLAARAGISKARLSQILSNEANPTVKSMARLFHALDEKVCVSRKRVERETYDLGLGERPSENANEWQWSKGSFGETRVDDKLVAVVKDTSASNDNYAPKVVYIESEDMTLEAA